MPPPVDLVRRYVHPFYLQMMRTNALDVDPAFLSGVRAMSAELDAASIERLLRDAWREQVMGTWYAVARPDLDLRRQLLDALRTSWGTLTSPALLAAAALEPGPEALDAIVAYEALDRQRDLGGAGLAHAAADVVCQQAHLSSGLPAATAENLAVLKDLQRVCRQLAG